MNAPSPCDPDTAGRTPRQAGEDMLGVVCHAPADYETLSARNPRLVVTRTPEGYRRQLYFGAGLGGGTINIAAHRPVFYCLEDHWKVE